MDMLDDNSSDIVSLPPRLACRQIVAPARVCESCFQNKAIKGNFDGDSMICLVCQDHQDQVSGVPVKRQALSRVHDAINKGYSVPQSADLLGFYYKEFRGCAGVAKEAKNVYDRALGCGDYKVAARILHTITQLQVKVSSDNQQLALATYSPEELRAHAEDLEAKIIQAFLKNPTHDLPALEDGNA